MLRRRAGFESRRPRPTWLLLAGLFGLFGLAAGLRAEASQPQAGLVIQGAEGQLLTFCIDLPNEDTTGLDLLQASGLDLAWKSILLGTMVCRIDETGCDYPAQDCWCQCKSLGGDCRYWAYQSLENGVWDYAIVGPSARKIEHGDVDGWAWGPGTVVAGAQPPVIPFAQICAKDRPVGQSGRETPATQVQPGASQTATPARPERPAPKAGSVASPGAPKPSATPESGAGDPASPDRTPASASRRPERSGEATPRATEPSADALPDAPAMEASSEDADDTTSSGPATPATIARAEPPLAAAEDAAAGGASGSANRRSSQRTSERPTTVPGAAATDPSPGSLDPRSAAGYLLFTLIVLGLVGVALSGRRS